VQQKARISILGCGWLGLPLARSLIREGHRVRGSTTREANLAILADSGIEPFLIALRPDIEGDRAGFLDSDILIVDFPPERREDIVEYHVLQSSSLIGALEGSPVRNVLLVSSTSVYPSLNREVTEEDACDPDAAETEAGKALLHVEAMLRSETGFRTTVVRFCGLIGYDRNPARYLVRMKESADPCQPMNLIHRDDAVGIIVEIIRQEVWGEVLNACAGIHPARQGFYGVAAAPPGRPVQPYKIVNSDKLLKRLGYRFLHPDPVQAPFDPGP